MNIKTEFLLPVMVLFTGTCQAMEWLFEPDFSFRERYEDNVTMQANSRNVVSTMISTFSPGVLLGYISENNELKTRFKWNELMYHSASDLDFSEKKLDLGYQYQAERFRFNLDGNYYEQSSINTQLEESGSGDLSSRRIPQTNRSISPSLYVNLTEKNALQLSYNYLDVSFDRPDNLQNLSYSDYTNQQYTATAIHSYSERLSFNISGSYVIFDSGSDANGSLTFTDITPINTTRGPLNVRGTFNTSTSFSQSSKTLSYQAGLQYAFDELTQLSLSAGMRNNDTQSSYKQSFSGTDIYLRNSQSSSSGNGHVFSASLTRRGEWGNFSLNIGQQLNPASSGSQQQTTSFSAQARYNLDERWSTGLDASYLISESTSTFNNTNTSYNRNYATLSPNIQWRWTPDISLQLAYTHREQEYTDRHQTATGNTVQLQFSYQPQINRQVK